jgi:hypothetical protein
MRQAFTIHSRNIFAMKTPDYIAIGFLIVSMLWVVARQFLHRLRRQKSVGGGPSMIDEVAHLLTTRIAQRLRDAGIGCEIVNLAPADAAVLRRDRIIVVLALALLTGLRGATCCGSRPT